MKFRVPTILTTPKIGGVPHHALERCIPFLLAMALVMPCPVTLPFFHRMPPAALMRLGRQRREHPWGWWDQHGRHLWAGADPVPVLREWAGILSAGVAGLRSYECVCVAA